MVKKPPPGLTAWVRPASQLIIALQKLGISFLSFHVLDIPGRRSGRMRATVVSPFTVDGRRYILSFGQLDWVKNARVAGRGILARGRQTMRVALVEVLPPGSAAIVREFPRQVPAGVRFFVRLALVDSPGTPDQFEAAAEKVVLFRVEPPA